MGITESDSRWLGWHVTVKTVACQPPSAKRQPPSAFSPYLCAMRKLSMDELNRKSVDDFRESEKLPLIVVLDNIRSMHNVGSVFRTADAFLLEGIYLCGYSPKPPHRDINKTALGSTDTVEWKYFATTSEAIGLLKDDGYAVYAIEQTEGSLLLHEAASINNGKIAVVFGNEVEGVGNEALKMCDGSIEIPQFGMKHSLNISVAAGIVLWELVRLRINREVIVQGTPGDSNSVVK